VHVLSADGGELAAAANAVAAALSDAAMPLRFSFAAATVSVAAAAAAAAAPAEGKGKGAGAGGAGDAPVLLLLDPTASEEARCPATATVAFPCASREPGGAPVVDSGSVLAVRCCSRVAAGGAAGGGAGGGKAGGGGSSESGGPPPSGFGADAECSLLAVAVDAAARGAQRVAEFGRTSLEASLGGGRSGGGA
jgi:hypothetical protein